MVTEKHYTYNEPHYVYNELGCDVELVHGKIFYTIKFSGAKEIPEGTYNVFPSNGEGFTWHESRYLHGSELTIDTDGTLTPFKTEE